MKVARCRDRAGEVLWAAINPDADTAVPLIGRFEEWAPTAAAGSTAGITDERAARPLSSLEVLAPLEPTAKVVCVGLNYRSHVEAFPNAVMPTSPLAFLKANTAVIAHGHPMRYPPLTSKLDYEIELVAVVARPISPNEPPAASLLGYTVGNDATGRDLQPGPRGHDLYSSKSLDDTSGVGPWITTLDELGPSPDLEMCLAVNGETRQLDRTSSMEWSVTELLEYANARTRLLPGDLVFTGTPAGVGSQDGRFLVPGDVVEARIERIGTLRNVVTSQQEAPVNA